jgi:error-prone DNA polymerase
VLTASMLGVVGRVQREGDVVHVIAFSLIDLSAGLASIGGREAPFPLPHGRGDEFARGPSAPDPREGPKIRARDLYSPDLRIDRLKQKTRDFH